MNNHSNVWKNITMIIFLLLLFWAFAILHWKFNVYVTAELHGIKLKIKIKFLWFNIERDKVLKVNKGKIKKKKKYNIPKILKNISYDKLSIIINVGAIGPFTTSLVVPIVSTAIPIIINKLDMQVKDLKYNVIPIYNDLRLDVSLDIKASIRLYKIIFNYFA